MHTEFKLHYPEDERELYEERFGMLPKVESVEDALQKVKEKGIAPYFVGIQQIQTDEDGEEYFASINLEEAEMEEVEDIILYMD